MHSNASGSASGGAPRLLLLMGQSPFDPSSGAAQSMRSTATLLARAGWAVRCLATTATENGSENVELLLHRFGGALQRKSGVLLGQLDRVEYQLFAVQPNRGRDWQQDVGVAYNHCYAKLLADWQPQVLLTFGGDAEDAERREQARAAGVRVVFALHNLAYLHPDAPESAREAMYEPQYLLAPSQFMASAYERALGRPVDVLPPPIDWADLLAPKRSPVFVTFVNPEPAKGLMFMATLAARLGRERPDVPLLIIEGRGKAEHFLAAGWRAGVDLARMPNILISPGGVRPKDIFANARVLLMPSVWDEPAGRLAIEAMVNGVPALVSDRGGLAEMVGAAGTALPVPADLTMDTRQPVPHAAVQRWLDLLLRLVDEPALYDEFAERARDEAALRFHPDTLAQQYKRYFDRVGIDQD